MKIEIAIQLIEKGIAHQSAPQRWVDLGAGTGLFTQALASRLSDGSTVMAIDQNAASLKSIAWNFPGIALLRKTADFTTQFPEGSYDGILMANALHFIPDAKSCLRQLKSRLHLHGRVIIVEYERRTANTWVPYPIRFEILKSVGLDAGFTSISKLNEVPSAYDNASIYSALLQFE
jgi:trans-aconitate methyltransferase